MGTERSFLFSIFFIIFFSFFPTVCEEMYLSITPFPFRPCGGVLLKIITIVIIISHSVIRLKYCKCYCFNTKHFFFHLSYWQLWLISNDGIIISINLFNENILLNWIKKREVYDNGVVLMFCCNWWQSNDHFIYF